MQAAIAVEVGAGGEEAQPARLDREPVEQLAQPVLVAAAHRADADGRAVAQRDVDHGGGGTHRGVGTLGMDGTYGAPPGVPSGAVHPPAA